MFVVCDCLVATEILHNFPAFDKSAGNDVSSEALVQRDLQKVRWRLLALGCTEPPSRCPLRSVPGMASESSAELGLTTKSAALQNLI